MPIYNQLLTGIKTSATNMTVMVMQKKISVFLKFSIVQANTVYDSPREDDYKSTHY